MAYLLILRRNQDQELGIDMADMLSRFQKWTGDLQASGSLNAVERLKPSADAVSLRQRDGVVAVEGRYDALEDVIGYYLLDVASVSAAQQLAADCPILAAGGSVEIRETEPFHSAE